MTRKNDNTDTKTPFEVLKFALTNPMSASILLLGQSGVGKTYTINGVANDLNLKLKSVAAIFAPTSTEGWIQLLGDLYTEQVKLLVIDHVEDMPMPAQSAMFHLFSNTHKELWSFPDRNYPIRIVFTSLKSTDELRNSAEIIMPHVYDRISQFIIRLKPLTALEDQYGLFKSVWKNMEFPTHNQIPNHGSLKSWIQNNCEKMNGNFRDLEKLALRWHNRRLMGYSDDSILPHIIREYQDVGFGAEPEHQGTVFSIQNPDGKTYTWASMEADFKNFVRKWAIEEFGSMKVAASKLDISLRTLERWK